MDSRTECPSDICLIEELMMVSDEDMRIRSPLTLENSPEESAAARSLGQSLLVESVSSGPAFTTRSGGMSLL